MSRASWAAEGCAGAWAAEKVERALEEAAGFLDKVGAYAIVSSTPDSQEYAEIQTYKTSLLTAFDQLKS
ncbi:ARM repeat superfamily protein [Zea mays]|uniref:ARM repeat superfamily protein n=1 Tax=Zea mays TaxID=4577 RepID=A0A1D6LD02_MAIZE|nr:ARM repeat superfamily protein [Zea mays]